MPFRNRRPRRLSPVLSDEPLVGDNLTRRVRVVLISVVVAFLLTNVTSYLIGQAVRADTERDTRTRVDGLERQFAADLEQRRVQREAADAARDRQLKQLRQDVCVAYDRLYRDAAVEAVRRRYGCTSTPPATATPQHPSAAGPSRPGAEPPARPGRQPGDTTQPGPAAPAAPTPPAPPGGPPDDGLVCLPLVGCLL